MLIQYWLRHYASPSRRDVLCFFHRWWWWRVCNLSARHLRWCVWLWWWSYSIFSPGRGPSVPSTLRWWDFTPGLLVIPASEHLFSPRRFAHSPGLWTARVSSFRKGRRHLELQEDKHRGALWTVWGRTQALSQRPHSRLGGRNIKVYYVHLLKEVILCNVFYTGALLNKF